MSPKRLISEINSSTNEKKRKLSTRKKKNAKSEMAANALSVNLNLPITGGEITYIKNNQFKTLYDEIFIPEDATIKCVSYFNNKKKSSINHYYDYIENGIQKSIQVFSANKICQNILYFVGTDILVPKGAVIKKHDKKAYYIVTMNDGTQAMAETSHARSEKKYFIELETKRDIIKDTVYIVPNTHNFYYIIDIVGSKETYKRVFLKSNYDRYAENLSDSEYVAHLNKQLEKLIQERVIERGLEHMKFDEFKYASKFLPKQPQLNGITINNDSPFTDNSAVPNDFVNHYLKENKKEINPIDIQHNEISNNAYYELLDQASTLFFSNHFSEEKLQFEKEKSAFKDLFYRPDSP